MTRLAPVVVLAGVALVGAAGAASATGHHDKPDTTHREVCHPTGRGWVVIAPAQASSHIDETQYPNGHYWKHEHDGRHDVYATNGACPPVGSPTSIPTTTPTEVPSSTPTTPSEPTSSTSTPPSEPTTSTTSQPTSPSPTSSTPTTGGPRPVAPSSQ